MKKRIFTFLTLLVAFFGLIGLTTNNYKVINAAGDQASVDFDASVAINSVPDTAILSFPVTYESVYGNDIAWTVVANDYITYDEIAHWMVVKRSTTTDGTAQIIVTVSNGTYEKTEEKTVTIPKGFTSAPIYNIEYDLKDGAFEEGAQVPTSYKLGDASFNLPIPTKTSFVFKGWLDAEGNEVKTILVGSMKSYSLTAQWEARSIKEIKVTKDPTKIEYKGGETIDLTGIEVTAYYNDETTEPISSEQLICKEYVNYGETKVELSYQGFTTSFNVTVEKNSWNIKFEDKTVTYNGTEHSVTINEELPTAVNVSYENNTLTNVGNVEAKVSFSWNTEDENYSYYSTNYDLPTCNPVKLTVEKADLTVTTTAQTVKLSEIANIVWKFEATGFYGEDSIEDVTITPKYYLEGKEVTDFIAGKTYDVEFTGVAANYNVEIEGSTLTIETEEVTFEIQGEYEYNGEEQTLVVKAYDANREEITGVLYDNKSSYSQVNAGTYKVTVTLEDEKYGDISQEVSFVIAKATATLSVKDTTSVYGEEVKLEYTATGFIESDLGKLNIQLTRNSELLNVGEYVVTLTYTDNANYDITEDLEGTHNITPKAATITMTPTTSIYGEEVNLTYTLEGFLESDLEDVNNNIKLTGAKQGDSVYEYTVTAEYQNANYNITINSAKHTITKRTATISVNTSNSIYGDAINLTYTTNNFYGNDLENFNIELSISSTDASKTPYEIKVEYEENPNYTINVESGTHTIAPKPLTSEDVNITVDEGDYNAQNANTLKPGVTIKYGEIEITTYEELEYAYADGYVGSATITITLTGNYSGTLIAQFEVTEYGKAGVDAALLPNTITEETTELPLTIGSSKVLWGTSNSAFSVDENGIVTVIHPTGDDVKVTLTAEVTYGTTSFYARKYQIVVSGLHRQQSNNVIVDNAEDVTLSVTVGENANYVVTPTEDNTYNTIAAYDISFTNESGEVSTFANPVTVRIPLPNDYNDSLTYAIWHKVGETYESVEYTVESGYFVFTATSFSPYIVTIVKNNYTIEFNANEGEGEMNSLPVVEGISTSLPVNTFERTGYTFTGWNTQADGQGVSYADKASISVTGNITLYAQWEENATGGEEEPETPASEVVDFTAQNYANEESVESYTGTNLIITLSKGSNASSSPKYYNTGTAVRIYGANTMTIDANLNIVKIILIIASGSKENTISTNCTAENPEDRSIIILDNPSKSITITVSGTSGHIRIQKMEIFFEEKTSDTSEQPETLTEYSLTLNLNSGILEDAPTKYVVADGLKLPTPTREGFEFVGWFDNVELNGDAVTEILANTRGDKEFWAKWEEDTNTGNEGDEGEGGETEPITTTYTFSKYTAGTQYAVNEEHKLDENVTITTTQCHFTSELRIYSSSTHNGYAIIKATKKNITSISVNAGNKADTLVVYGSTNGTDWTSIGEISVTSSYQDYTLNNFGEYTYLKLDVEGDNQIRIASMTLTME